MLIYIILFILGAVLASFVHVYATRVLKGESFISPRSHCSKCKHPLKWYELIPIVSYLIQKGRCRVCNSKIGKDVIWVEFITGTLFVLIYLKFGISYMTLLGFTIILVMISIFITDFKEMVILDSTLVVGTILSYIFIFFEFGLRGIYKAFLYGIFAFVLFFIIKIVGDAIFKRESLGGGDIKLAFLMGSILPYGLFLFAILIASCVALPYAVVSSEIKKSHEFAFGPFLAIGLLLVFTFQSEINQILGILTV